MVENTGAELLGSSSHTLNADFTGCGVVLYSIRHNILPGPAEFHTGNRILLNTVSSCGARFNLCGPDRKVGR